MNLQGIQKIAKNIGDTAVKNSPTLLTALSVAGLATTTIMGGRATIKAVRMIDELEQEEKEIDPDFKCFTKREVIKATWTVYIPTAIMGAITIGCIIGANSINLRRNAAMASLYSLSETALKEYQAKVVEVIGENKEKEIQEEIKKDRVKKDRVKKNSSSGSEVIITGTGEVLCFDAMSGRYFNSSSEAITAALNRVSRRLMTDMFINLNEIYFELGLEGTKLGDLVGWHIDQVGSELIKPDFSTQLSEDGRPCLVLDFEIEPKAYDRSY